MKKSLKKILGLMAICACSFSVGVGLMQEETVNAKADAVTLETLETFAMYGGASTRLNEPYGLRFKTEISASEYAGLVEAYGEDNISFGTLIAPLDLLDEGIYSLTLENAQVKDNQIADLPMQYWSKTEESVSVKYFNAAITNIKETNLSRKYTARSYLTVNTVNGEETVYADTDRYNEEMYHRSILDVADSAMKDAEWLADTKVPAGAKTFVGNTLNKGVDYSDRILFVTADKYNNKVTTTKDSEGVIYSTGISGDVTLTRNGVSETKTAVASVQIPAFETPNLYPSFRFAPDFSKTNLQRMKDMGYATFRVTYGVETPERQLGAFEPTLIAGGAYTAKDDSSTYRYTNKWYTLDFDIDVLLDAQSLLAVNTGTYVPYPLIKLWSTPYDTAYTVYFAEIGFTKEIKDISATATITDSAENSFELTEETQYVGMTGEYNVQVALSQSEYAHLYNTMLVKDGAEEIDLKGLNSTVTLAAGQYVLKAEPMLPLDVDASFTYAFSVEEELTSVSAIDDVNDILTLHQGDSLNGLYFANGMVHPDNVTASETNKAITDANSVEKTAIYQYDVDFETRATGFRYRPNLAVDFAFTAEELIALKDRGLTKFRMTFMMQADESEEVWRLVRNMRVLSGIDTTSNDFTLANATYTEKTVNMNEWITVEFDIQTIIDWFAYIDATAMDAEAYKNQTNYSYYTEFSNAVKGVHSLIQMSHRTDINANDAVLKHNYTVYVAECAFVKE